MQTIQLQPIRSQTVSVQLAGQPCQIAIFAKESLFDPIYAPSGSTTVFCTLSLNNAVVIASVPCWQANRIVRDVYLGFAGDLAIYDTQGGADPEWTGLGSRWVLVYLSVADLAAAGVTG